MSEIHAALFEDTRTSRFKSDPLSKDLIKEICECALKAPSVCNLQPSHLFLVEQGPIRQRIQKACFGKSQSIDAPLLVIFTGDRRAASNNLERVISISKMSPTKEEKLRTAVSMCFESGFLGINWLAKFISTPILRLFSPMPSLPGISKKAWLSKEVSRASSYFTIACKMAGLEVVPIEIFDDWRIKFACNIPLHHTVVSILAVGYPLVQGAVNPKLPPVDFIHKI